VNSYAFIARICHEANRAYCQAIGDNSQLPWDQAPEWQRDSAIAGVKFHLNNPEAGPAGSHKSWMETKTADGWTYGPVKNERHKEHPCMLPFDQLPAQQQAKDYIFTAIVRTMDQALVQIGLEELAKEAIDDEE
jgi:RyR domain